jgi:ribosome-associated protein
MSDSIEQIIELAKAVDAKKGFNISIIDVKGLCQVADYFIIAEGNVEKHLDALADALLEKAKSLQIHPLYIEGRGADWLVIDFAGIMAHLMLPAARDLYKLEQLWDKGKFIPVEL